MISATVAVAALLQWLFFWSRMVFRRDSRKNETAFLLSTVAAAVVWTWLAAAVRTSSLTLAAMPSMRKSGCASVTTGMAAADVRTKLGAPSRMVSEADSRGPGAEAWVYDDARCVAHMLNEQVRAVDYE